MRRTALILAVCLVFGVVVNYGVAWWIMLTRNYPHDVSEYSMKAEFRADERSWLVAVPDSWPNAPHSTVYLKSNGFELLEQKTWFGSESPHQYICDRTQVGMPFRSLQRTAYLVRLPQNRTMPGGVADDLSSEPPELSFVSGIRIPKGWNALHFTPYAPEFNLLPIMPIWPGFAINTLIFALVPALLWLPLGPLKRARRRRRGRCVSCGYDLSGITGKSCPECGNTRGDSPEETPA